MTVKELIAELQRWPDWSEVYVTPHLPDDYVGNFPSAPIVTLSGVAGAAIDGRDSVVMVEHAPYRDDEDGE